MAQPESYIVRIYRRNRKNPRQIAGVVEKVGGNARKAGFENIEELNAILTHHLRVFNEKGHKATIEIAGTDEA